MNEDGGIEIFGEVQVMRGPPDFSESDVDMRWNDAGRRVELFIRGKMYAYFDLDENRGVPGRYPDTPLVKRMN
jgi:hypothetical protein